MRPEVEEETPQVIPSAIQEVTEYLLAATIVYIFTTIYIFRARTLEVSAVAAGFRQPSPP